MNKHLLLHILILPAFITLFFGCQEPSESSSSEEWIALFDGSIEGWTANENQDSWQVEDGILVGVGPRSHLFYTGKHLGEGFDNFELTAEVKTHLHANSGIYINTEYQEEGWPSSGNEIQVNNTHIGAGDYIELKKGGSLYSIRNTYKTFVEDSVWYTTRILVQGNNVKVWLNDIKIVDYSSESIGSEKGTFALQCHDPGSLVHYRNIMVKRFPPSESEADLSSFSGSWNDSISTYQSQQFAFIDLHPQGETGIDDRIKFYYESGINVAYLTDAAQLNDPGEWRTAFEQLQNSPVFFGSIADDESISNIQEDNISLFEYIVGIIPEGAYNNKSEYLVKARTILENPNFDIWSKPFYTGNLPIDFTESDIDELLDWAASNNIALEIDHQLKLPEIDIIRKAKEKGLKFTMANMSSAKKIASSNYIFEVIRAADLGYKDFFVPGW